MKLRDNQVNSIRSRGKTYELQGWKQWYSFFKKEYNVKFVPDVNKYELKVGKYDKDFKEFGIWLRTWRKVDSIELWGNRRQNKYMVYMLKRFWFCKDHPIKRIKLIILILRSKTFFVAAINHVDKYWFNKSKFVVDRVWKKYYKISNIMIHREYESKRIFIPKSNGKVRPLGVPKLWERIHFHILNKLLMMILNDHLDNTQHGYTGKGTLTAWREVLSKAIKWDNIYEYDLKGFFDNVLSLQVIVRVNKEFWQSCIEFSKEWGKDIHRWLFKALKEYYGRLLDRFWKDRLIKYLVWINQSVPLYGGNGTENWDSDPMQQRSDFWAVDGGKYWFTSNPQSYPSRSRGFPQGAPHSPMMSMIGKSLLTEEGKEVTEGKICYVDDGIANKKVIPNIFSGCYLSDSKSGWVKKDGKWIKPLKFLGLIYDGRNQSLTANTRKGSTLEATGKPIEIIMKKLSMKHMDWEKIANSKYFGWLLSRLYVGSWKDPQFKKVKFLQPTELEHRWDWLLIDKYKGISGTSINSYLMGIKNNVDWRNKREINETNKSSMMSSLFLDSKEWNKIPVDPKNIYYKVYKETENHSLYPMIRRNKQIFLEGNRYKDWLQLRYILKDGMSSRIERYTWPTTKYIKLIQK